MKKPDFEHFRQSLLRKGKPLPQQAREPYREGIVRLLEDTGLMLVQKSRKDGHNEVLVEVHGSWIGADFSADAVTKTLRELWPDAIFEGGEQKFWVEAEEEIVTLQFAWDNGDGQYLTGRVKIVLG